MKFKTSREERPKLKLELSWTDKIFELLGITFTALMWVFALFVISSSVDKIPTHYSFSGKPDSFGSKYTILLLPAINLAVFILLTILNKYPHVFNYPIKITSENSLRQYTLATKAIRFLKTTLSLLFLIITYFTYKSSLNGADFSGIWILPTIIIFIELPMLFYIWKATKIK